MSRSSPATQASMSRPLNPESRLSHPPANACLHEEDGRVFSALLQAGRYAACIVSGNYPRLLDDPDSLVRAYESEQGVLVLAHLSGLMYSYWDVAPQGPCVFHVAMAQLTAPLDATFRDECAEWGHHRLSAKREETMYIVDETEEGTIIADHNMERFYRILGMKQSPGAALRIAGIALPARARITALPFRGALVHDGIFGRGCKPKTVSAERSQHLAEKYAAARAEHRIITGFHPSNEPPQQVDVRPPPGEQQLRDLSLEQLKEFIRARGDMTETDGSKAQYLERAMEVRGKVVLDKRRQFDQDAPPVSEDSLSAAEKDLVSQLRAKAKRNEAVICRRFGYTEAENPNHLVTFLCHGMILGSFQSNSLLPSAMEILSEFLKLCDRLAGGVADKLSVDDLETALQVQRLLKLGGVQVSFYPEPSVEEQVLLTDVPPPVIAMLETQYF